MRVLFMTRPFKEYDDVCPLCGKKTPHHTEFLAINVLTEQIMFFTYCKRCEDREHDRVMGYEREMSIADSLQMFWFEIGAEN